MVFIDSVKFGEIVIDGKTYYSDVAVSWDGSVEMRAKKHIFSLDDFKTLKKKGPDTVIIGSGEAGAMAVEGDVREAAGKENIDFFVERSQQAIRLFNSLVAAKRKAIAVIHTTC
jgi:hypothetical protein